MKKFMIGCAYTAVVLIVIGMVMGTVASRIKGRTTIEDVVESVTGGRVKIGLDPFSSWGIQVGENDFIGWMNDMDFPDENVWLEETDFLEHIDEPDFLEHIDDIGFDSRYSILRGNVDRYSLGSDIRELNFEVGACAFTTKVSPDENFYLEANYAGKFQGYVEDNTLYIRSSSSVKRWDDLNGCQITFYIPESVYFDSADIEVGAGRLSFDRLQADKVELAVGAGQITLNDLMAEELEVSVGLGQIKLKEVNVGELDAEVGLGDFTLSGTLDGDADMTCSMGNVSLRLEGSQRDFNYELSKALGNVTLGNSGSSGFSSQKYIDNNASKTIGIDCAMGNVSVQFVQ